MKIIVTVATVLIVGLCSTIAQDQINSRDELLAQVPNISGLPNLNASALPSQEDLEKSLREKCTKNGGPGAYDTMKEVQPYVMECYESVVNVTRLQRQMEAARPEGKLDEVFKEYCDKVPVVKACVQNATLMIEPCLEVKEKESMKIINNITASLLKFVCHKDGDRIALFIAAGGQECLGNKSESMQRCMNSTFEGYAPAAGSMSSLSSAFPLLVLGNRECHDMVRLQECTVKELETCKDPTPANVVDSLFNFIKRVTPCENLLNTEAASQRGSGVHVTNILLLTVLMGIFARFA